MKQVDLYGRVRHAVLIDGMSRREASKVFGVDPRTVAKMLAFSVPPGYRRRQPAHRPKLDAFTGIIDQILEADKLVPRKQRHTSKRVFERLRDEHGFTGGITIVKDYIFTAKQRQREMFVPLAHPPGHAQADFGEALAVTLLIYVMFTLSMSAANFNFADQSLWTLQFIMLGASAVSLSLVVRNVKLRKHDVQTQHDLVVAHGKALRVPRLQVEGGPRASRTARGNRHDLSFLT